MDIAIGQYLQTVCDLSERFLDFSCDQDNQRRKYKDINSSNDHEFLKQGIRSALYFFCIFSRKSHTDHFIIRIPQRHIICIVCFTVYNHIFGIKVILMLHHFRNNLRRRLRTFYPVAVSIFNRSQLSGISDKNSQLNASFMKAVNIFLSFTDLSVRIQFVLIKDRQTFCCNLKRGLRIRLQRILHRLTCHGIHQSRRYDQRNQPEHQQHLHHT